MDSVTFSARYDAMIDSRRMRALYGSSGYFNVGYWEPGVTKLVEACDRLVDEVASVVPGDASLILDTGCGVGAGTCRVAASFPRAFVLGVNISHGQLLQARRRGVENPVVMDAACLAIAHGVADAVIALESAQHFDTRAAFLSEACRVLRPGGVITLADVLFNDPQPAGTWMLPSANTISTVAEYADEMGRAGFVDVKVRDVTDLCWRPYCKVLRGVYPDREEMVEVLEASVAFYILASALKP